MLSTTPLLLLLAAVLLLLGGTGASAEDGYDLWLRYHPLERAIQVRDAPHATAIVVRGSSPTLAAAANELQRGLSGLLAHPVAQSSLREGAIVLDPHGGIGGDGFHIRSARVGGHHLTLIAAHSDIGVLYGAFEFLRLVQTGRSIANLDVRESPKLPLRMLDHWDNLDGTVERGYAGPSLWNWAQLPHVSPRMIDYARANASIGINAVVLNNVNADARILTAPHLEKVAALADAWRPYGIRVFLSARFSAPIDIGGLRTADPLDPAVRAWWRAADEIYRRIPDLGGFLVKANSEGQPGPATYGRSHADGANMLAQALAPHGGTVLWRAFVYGHSDEDRAKQAYDEFRSLDGKFAPNVIVQVKNGPVDFQPREPFHPLFGQMPRTNLALEAQVTREYLGQGSGIVYLGPLWSEVLNADACSPHCGTPVRSTIRAIAGVANAGSDRNWTGNQFDQANWYAFGRLAWDPAADPRQIAEEWTRMTWGNDPRLVRTIVPMMMSSRQATVDYMTPLGLAHLMASDHHYGPGPWVNDQPAPLWNPTYYHRADARGIGFDRTASGTNSIAQYAPEVGRCFADLKCISDDELLWFHHLPWTYRMRSGPTLWEELVRRYDRGVAAVDAMNRSWSSLAPMVDSQRRSEMQSRLERQLIEARWWRDASIAYFQSISHLALPPGSRAPRHDVAWYKSIHFDTVPGFLTPGTGRQPSCVPPAGGPPCAL